MMSKYKIPVRTAAEEATVEATAARTGHGEKNNKKLDPNKRDRAWEKQISSGQLCRRGFKRLL